jgi:hypothetical protein
MDKSLLDKFLRLLKSETDSDAVMGLRGAQNLFKSAGASLEDGLRYAADHLDKWKSSATTIDHKPTQKEPSAASAVAVAGMPGCRMARAGVLELVPVGKDNGDLYPLPGESAKHAEHIAHGLKDAIVAAVINKSRFKLKLNDLKATGETALQAEYERAGMTPVQIWVNNRGEVGALATVLRKAVANSLPELAAA